MMNTEQFKELTAAVASLNNLTLEEAAKLVAEAGDTPALADDGERVEINGKAYLWPQDDDEED